MYKDCYHFGENGKPYLSARFIDREVTKSVLEINPMPSLQTVFIVAKREKESIITSLSIKDTEDLIIELQSFLDYSKNPDF
tara:strand:- start:180 stop:422 length:243 start_codon:yes stop_codon:yes gene_type:complete